MTISQTAWDKPEQNWWIALTIGLLAAVAFYFSTQPSHEHFDYTFRIASAFPLRGHVGLQTPAPSWLNEMVPLDGHYYSVFPLGAVLSMVPVALLQEAGLITKFPGRAVAAVLAGLCVYFFFKLSVLEGRSCGRRLFLAFFPIFGTWAWCNLGFAGAWQIALGFLVPLGEIGALYFTLVRPRPLVAGAFLRSPLAIALNFSFSCQFIFIFGFSSTRAIGLGRNNWVNLSIDFGGRPQIFSGFLAFRSGWRS